MGKFLLVVVVFAACVYGVFWLLERRRAGRLGPRPSTSRRPAPRVTGPDDDDDFLRELDRRRRMGGHGSADGPADGPADRPGRRRAQPPGRPTERPRRPEDEGRPEKDQPSPE